jgi:hypothetical protein
VPCPPCPYAVSVVTAETGHRQRVLFEMPNGRFPQRVATDRSGNHVVAVTVGDRLDTWSTGDKKPKQISEEVVAAAWVPRP